MHKITKGLKKKKKGKKSKHKEDDLFKPEELEAYRREHQQPAEAADESGTSSGQNEEWKKFLALTSGVDDILKKTQGDLDRIKSTSFFQRVPPPSEVKKQEETEAEAKQEAEEEQARKVEQEKQESADLGIVQVSESEDESEEEDDIFDTTYIDAIATGEVKLAYIPESPTDQPGGDDPFDTSIAERAILGPAVERKGKKLVPIGAAVEVLTGRVQAPTCATKRPVSTRRQVLKERDLLLGSFDDNANSIQTDVISHSPEEVPKTLLDDAAPLPDEPIDLSQTLYIPPVPPTNIVPEAQDPGRDILSEFDVVANAEPDDDEFAQLAAESLSKPVKAVDILPSPAAEIKSEANWQAFADERQKSKSPSYETGDADPFDTTFAENILPGKAELKVIESEVLSQGNDFEFDPRADERISQILNTVTISVVDVAGGRESVTSLDRISESELNLIKPIHRDLLGGSNTDLSNLSDQPLKPAETVNENYIEYCDPFDTSIVETAKLPGQTELKFIEKELLGDLHTAKQASLSDDEFDPRADEQKQKERTLSRPDVLNITPVKTVSFDLPSPTQNDLLTTALEPTIKKPVTPFYVRRSSIAEEPLPEELTPDDPFDTSFVTDVAPGKAELKLIENELFNPVTDRNLSISDQDFDPRNDKIVQIAQVKQTIREITDPNFAKQKDNAKKDKEPIDLLAVDNDISVKVLTPSANTDNVEEEISYVDPFDTSIASNILPGKTELKLLETELIHSTLPNISAQDFDPRSFTDIGRKVDLLEHTEDSVIDKPLSPVRGQSVSSFDNDITDDIDPFDTSIANNIGPGKTELKLIESELI